MIKCTITNHPSSFPHGIFFKFHISLQQSLPIFTIYNAILIPHAFGSILISHFGRKHFFVHQLRVLQVQQTEGYIAEAFFAVSQQEEGIEAGEFGVGKERRKGL